MNKEKLEQMKKERLEQMKELGRGGISRGLSLLQKANTALNTTPPPSQANGDSGDSDGATETTSLTSKPSYDDLVGLSMKLTRQNKLMKAQFQKMQARIVELSTKDADCRVLTEFVTDVVGVDVIACQSKPQASKEGESDAGDVATIDGAQLRERFEIVEALKTKAFRQQLKTNGASNEATKPQEEEISLLPMSPMAPSVAKTATTSTPQYEEIDLLGEAYPLVAPPRPKPSSDYSGDLLSLDMPPASNAAASNATAPMTSNDAAVLEKQLDDATEQLRRLESEMKRSACENEELRQKFNDMWAQRTTQLDQLTQQMEAERQSKLEVESKLRSLTSLNEELQQRETAFEAEKTALQSKIQELDQQIDALRVEAATLKAQANSVSQLDPSQSNPHDDALTPLLEELERTKLARAEADHALKSLQEKLSTGEKRLTKALNDAEQNTAVIEALRSEIARLMDEIKRVETDKATIEASVAALRAEKVQLEESKEELEEQLQVLRANNSSNLESVVGELAEAKRQAAEQREYTNSKIEVLVKDLDAARRHSASLEMELAEKDTQCQRMATSQASLTREVMELQRQVSGMQEDLQMAAEGLEAHANKAQESELRRRELDEKLTNARMQLETLKDQHLNDLEMLRSGKETELDRVRHDRTQLLKKLSEAEAASSSLSVKYNNVQDELEHEKKRTNELEGRVGQLTAEVGNLSIDLAETKKALSDRMALATRLQTENMGFAEKQAEQAARVEAALRDAASRKQEVVEKENKVTAAMAEVAKFQKERDNAVDEMAQLRKALEAEKQQMALKLAAQEVKFRIAVGSEKEAFKRELERVESDSKNKSKLALHAVLEKEAEIERLSKRLAELEEDVRSGDADNRKIFEFAQMQANRELEARANGARIHELTRELEIANGRVQELLQDQARHGEEITAMMQTQRREGVNVEYLKNVIVQFMSFKPGSSQQTRLVPVITTLLQFTAADMKEIKKAGRRSSWGTWGAEVPDYKPITLPPSGGGNGPTTPTRRRTSPPTDSSTASADSISRASSFTLPPHHEEDGLSSAAFAPHPNTQSADF